LRFIGTFNDASCYSFYIVVVGASLLSLSTLFI